MSPKEQATAAKLLRRWLDLSRASARATDPSKVNVREMVAVALQLQQLEEETRAFVAHEDPDA